ncbi:MAG: cysteine--tRNA ligase [Phycisphaerae bacterium]|nr:cysteine--tRNA ligase [Phycisphaerae bacterium]
MPLRLHNTLTRAIEEFVPEDPARVTFYTCGPTVYDDAHIGNFRSFLAADLLRRFIESPLCELRDARGGVSRGPRRVVHVMNITDVGHMTDDAEGGESGEDRMAVAGRRLMEAKKSGTLPAGVTVDPSDPYQIARFYEGRFKEDARRLGLKLALESERDPTLQPRATDHVPGMIRLTSRLIEKGFAYVVGEPGSRVVYFRVRAFPAYGRLSGNTLEKLREGEGGRISRENQSAKEHPADFLLWKEDPRHVMKWESPWGWGYPGWHVECSVMSVAGLIPGAAVGTLTRPDGQALIDLHSGGEDNIFPHHECEIAQSCGAFNADPARGTFARMWFHPRFLLVEGAKMSKSKGNFFTPRDLFARGVEPAALRLELIRTHYRGNANFTLQGLADSQRMIERWRRAAGTTPGAPDPAGAARSPAAAEFLAAFASAMHEDLNVAAAVAAVNSFVGRTEPGVADAPHALRVIDEVLGVLSLERPAESQTGIAVFVGGLAQDASVVAKLDERAAAKRAKDFAKSDAIRDELLRMGFTIKDVAGGRVEVSRA